MKCDKLQAYKADVTIPVYGTIADADVYLKSEADEVIAEKDAEIRRLKNRIAPKQSDKTLQERLNEVCEKHGVSTLQDLDWAFCITEARLEDYAKISIDKHKALEKMLQYKVLYKEMCRDINTQERFFALKIAHQKYKRCMAMHDYCLCELEFSFRDPCIERSTEGCVRWRKWANLWLELAEKFKEAK